MSSPKLRVVLITGASKGLGAGIAKAFAKEGACLCLVATGSGGPKEFDDVVQQCKDLGSPNVLKICTDLSEQENMEMVINETIKTFSKLDVLVNNAGILCIGTIEDIKLEEFDKAMKLNTRTPLYLTQLAIPHLEKTKGNIVNISSILGTLSSVNKMTGYCLTKAALDQLTKITALDLASKGVRVNSINPGMCDTPFLQTLASAFNMEPENFKKFAESVTPLGGKLLQPNDVADATLFLASEKAKMITGVNLPVDCGKLLSG